LNARLKLIGTGILLCLALGLTVFCAIQTVQAIQRFEQDRKLAISGDVSTISSWMTVPYIARFYHVPESYLDESLHITNGQSVRHDTLRVLADRVKRPVNSLIHDIQQAILNYRNQRSGSTRARATACNTANTSACCNTSASTRATARVAPTIHVLRGSLFRNMVGATLAVALVRTRAVALVRTRAVALVHARAVALVRTRAVALVHARAVALVHARAVALVRARAVALVRAPLEREKA